MSKTYMMAKANIAKMKFQGVVLVILLTITAMMLNLGFMLALTFSGYMHDIAAELNTLDAFYTLPYEHLTEDVRSRIENHEQIASLHVYDGVILPSRILEMFDGEVDVVTIFRNKDIIPSVSGWMQVGDVLENVENPIFLPHVFSADVFGFNLGDNITFVIDGESLVFTVAGFTGDVFGHGNMSKAYVSEQSYNELIQRFGQHHAALLFADIYGDEGSVNAFMRGIFTEGVIETNSQVLFFGLDRDLRISARGAFAELLSLLTITFASIIVIVCIIIIRFSINNKIEQDFSQLGSLKAAGYTSIQIRAGLLAQYLSLAVVSCILGIPLVRLILPFISDLMAQQTGLFWQPDFNSTLAVAFLTFSVVVLLVASFALYCSRKIRTIDPVTAIRGGASGHSFKRNYLPLNKTMLPLNIAIGGKLSLQSIGQSLALLLIFTAIAFTATFSVSTRHAATRQSDAIDLAQGREVSDTILEIAPDADSHLVRDEVSIMPGVVQAIFLDYDFIDVNNDYVPIFVMDDFTAKEYPSVFSGRYPVHINEVAISWRAAELWNVDIDDILHIGDTMFVVTGITQGAGAIVIPNGEGPTINLTTQGARTVLPGFTQSRLYVYLSQEMDVQDFISEVTSIFGWQIINAQNWRASSTMALAMFLDMLTLITTVLLIFVAAIILFAIYFITVAVIIRRHRFLGIQKAMGCTTFDLMQQMSASFMLPLIVGIIIGTVIAVFTSNNIAAMLMGVREVGLYVPYVWMALTGLALAVISYASILIITGRIRKISAYDLVR